MNRTHFVLTSIALTVSAAAGCAKESTVGVSAAPGSSAPPPAPAASVAPSAATGISSPEASAAPAAASSDRITVCTGQEKRDMVSVERARIEGDTLQLDTSFSGGCAEHALGVCYEGRFSEGQPVQVAAVVWHDAHGDSCKAISDKHLAIDLGPLKKAYQDAYKTQGGKMSIGLPGQSVLYPF